MLLDVLSKMTKKHREYKVKHFCRVGEAYPADALSKDAKILMKDFSKFGLIYLAFIPQELRSIW